MIVTYSLKPSEKKHILNYINCKQFAALTWLYAIFVKAPASMQIYQAWLKANKTGLVNILIDYG